MAPILIKPNDTMSSIGQRKQLEVWCRVIHAKTTYDDWLLLIQECQTSQILKQHRLGDIITLEMSYERARSREKKIAKMELPGFEPGSSRPGI